MPATNGKEPMVSKIALLVAGAAGYVLGTRDGRERYEQIRSQARSMWSDPRFQQKKQQAQDLAKDKGSELGDVAKKKARSAGSGSDTDSAETGPVMTSGTTTSSDGVRGGSGG